MSMRGSGGIDGWVEGASRWASTRLTRRSFLGKLGRTAVLVGAGPVIGSLLAESAEARVCGQTGVSPRCPTFDCNGIWGWCWYATGCCAGGLLKKICDCCARNWPNVRGYCPSGTAVRCIVESCGTDPRLQRVDIARIDTDSDWEVSIQVRGTRFSWDGSAAVIADRESPWNAVAIPLAAMLNGPVFLSPRHDVDQAVIDEIALYWGRRAFIVGPHLSPTIDQRLKDAFIETERIGSSLDVETFSGQVADWVRRRIGPRNTVTIANHGLSMAAAPLAAAWASTMHMPLTIGSRAQRAGAGAFLVGPEAAAFASSMPGAEVISSDSLGGMAEALWHAAAFNEGFSRDRVLLAPAGWGPIWELASFGLPILLHEPGSLNGARDWLLQNRHAISRVYLAGRDWAIGGDQYKLLQSDINAFEIHKLIGTAGQGLPVYEQPLSERPIGRARLGTDPPPPRPAPPRRRARRRPRRRARRRR